MLDTGMHMQAARQIPDYVVSNKSRVLAKRLWEDENDDIYVGKEIMRSKSDEELFTHIMQHTSFPQVATATIRKWHQEENMYADWSEDELEEDLDALYDDPGGSELSSEDFDDFDDDVYGDDVDEEDFDDELHEIEDDANSS